MPSKHQDRIEVRSDRLVLRPLPPEGAGCLPADRDRAAELIGASLDAEWPLPDLFDLLPVHARRSVAEARFGVWTVIERATSTVVGDIGFIGRPDGTGAVELGYSIVPSRRRRGYASESATAVVAWAFDQPDVRSILAGTDPDNAASQRVLERVGFERTGGSATEVRWRLDRDGVAR